MGGRIWAKPLPDKGAEFGFSIPAYVDELDAVTDHDEDSSRIFDRDPEPSRSAATA
jgi:hypothetical protein